MISPKNVMAKVTLNVTAPTIISVGDRVLASSHIRNVQSVTKATFAKLFMTRIVASNKWGFFNSATILLSLGSSDSRHLSRSSLLSEKNATSDAETMADKPSKKMIAMKLEIKKVSGEPDSKSASSVLLGGSSKEVGVSNVC
jgi:hypothetical protein